MFYKNLKKSQASGWGPQPTRQAAIRLQAHHWWKSITAWKIPASANLEYVMLINIVAKYYSLHVIYDLKTGFWSRRMSYMDF